MVTQFRPFLLALALAGCGASDAVVQQCTDQCLAAAGCPDAADSCPDLCEAEREFSNHIECSYEYEAMLDCLDTAPDVCDQFGGCPDEVSVYFDCYGAFCVANPKDEQCDDVEPPDEPVGGFSF